MGTVTPVVVPGDGYVRVEVTWTDFTHTRRVWIDRVTAGAATRLRDGDYAWLSAGIGVAFDHEAPLDTPVQYRSTIPLNYNGDFEAGVLEWLDTTSQGTVGVVSRSLDYSVSGNASAKLVQDVANATVKAVSEYIPATAATSYTITGRLMVSDYWTGGIGVQIQWYNGTTYLSSSGALNDLTPFPGVFGSYGFSATAPATTTAMRLVFGMAGTPPTTLALYADDIYASTSSGSTTVTSAPVTIPSNGGGWWCDPLHPATKVRLQIDLDQALSCGGPAGIAYLGVGPEKTLAADGAAMAIEGSPYSVPTYGVRKAPRSAMRVATPTLADLARVEALHSSGAPLLLSMNAAYGEPQQYQMHGDVTEGRTIGDQRQQWRLIGSEFSETLPPVGPAEGTLRSRYADITKYATFAAATTAGATWLDVLRGNATA